jgi:hypothetical protein
VKLAGNMRFESATAAKSVDDLVGISAGLDFAAFVFESERWKAKSQASLNLPGSRTEVRDEFDGSNQ